jgi:hypothetical protein
VSPVSEPAKYGPHRVSVAATPTGATLDVRALVADVLHDIATGPLLDDLYAYAEALETGDHPDPHEPEPLRLERLLDALDCRAFVYGGEVGELSQRLADIARPKPLPRQQDRRAS